MQINPYAWLLTLPLTVLLISLYCRPADCLLRRWWGELARMESDIWMQLGCAGEASWIGVSKMVTFGLCVGMGATSSLVSLAVFFGLGHFA